VPDAYEREFLHLDASDERPIYRAKGCRACSYEGYRGRVGIYEVILVDEHLGEKIHSGASEVEMERIARSSAPSIRADGRRKVLEGVTTMDEILRVTLSD